MQRNRFGFLVRVAVAAAAIGGILLVASQSLFPQVPLAARVGYSLLALAVVGGLAVAGFFIVATINQAVLRKGGTDTQWFWFGGEPKGLESLRGDRRGGGSRQ